MKSRMKRKLAALLAFAMIATSVMPAMAEMDLEVLPEKAAVEVTDTGIPEVSAEVNEIEEIETGAAEAPEPV